MPGKSTSRCGAVLATLLLLSGCGGGGGGGSGGGGGGGGGTPTNVTITGQVRFTRVPFRASPYRLDYPNPILQPARGVILRAIDATTQVQLAAGETSSTGSYSLSVPTNASIQIQVVAQMKRNAVQLQGPSWDVKVQNTTGGSTAPYSYTTATFNSGVGVQDIDIPLGIDANGNASGVRASGPFAILDTIYLAIQTVLTVNSTAVLPPLSVDWGAQHAGTFFSINGGQHIALLSDLTEDTDEFDRHTIAHEFGHYIENNFSRSDNIGGTHGLGDRLDPRVAFGEGWGYAFAAIVLNDPLVLDSFVNNGQPVAGGFVVELNPPAGLDGPGCWCSESTVWSLLWDLYDNVADVDDNVALGFAPLWSALTGAERTTPALTTIFSFIDALKTARPQDAAAIDALVTAQNIDSAGINAFAGAETHAPLANTLPVYTNIVKGTPVVVRSIADAGHYNRVGNHRFLRYTAQTSGNITVTVTTSNSNGNTADPDFIVLSSGVIVGSATNPPNAQHNEVISGLVTAGTDYILDVYDCANGCSDVEGTPGNYDLTVSIQ